MQVSSSRQSPYLAGFIIVEGVLMAAGMLLASYLRLGAEEIITSERYTWYQALLVPVVLQIWLYYFNLYDFRVAKHSVWYMARVCQAIALGFLSLAIIYYVAPPLEVGRGIIGMAFGLVTFFVLLWRGIYSWALTQRLFATRVLLLGTGELADSICEELLSRSDNIYNIVCILDPLAGEDIVRPNGTTELNIMKHWARLMRAEVSNDADELIGLIRYHEVDLVIAAMVEKRGTMPLDELLRARMAGIPVVSGEDFFEEMAGKILADRIRPSWLIFSEGFRTSSVRSLTKRAMDVALSIIGLILASPLALLTAIAVKLDSKGPAIYKQTRVGQGNREFQIMKFRSMRTDAEDKTGPVWSQEGDSRVTRVGKFIRKTRLDEIPQMWNVLRGEMSFVGPRPERPLFVNQLTDVLPYYEERHNVKPGITGWAQVCYPYGSSVGASLQKLNYDLYYIKHSNFSMDILIILQTAKVMLFGGGGR